MYTVRAWVSKGGDVQIAMRSRQNIKGYTYIDVYVLCSEEHE